MDVVGIYKESCQKPLTKCTHAGACGFIYGKSCACSPARTYLRDVIKPLRWLLGRSHQTTQDKNRLNEILETLIDRYEFLSASSRFYEDEKERLKLQEEIVAIHSSLPPEHYDRVTRLLTMRYSALYGRSLVSEDADELESLARVLRKFLSWTHDDYAMNDFSPIRFRVPGRFRPLVLAKPDVQREEARDHEPQHDGQLKFDFA